MLYSRDEYRARQGEQHETIYRILAALAVAGVLLAATVMVALSAKGEEAVMTSTETAPIYNHFPDLPETAQIKWCSKSSGGIGLVTTKLYIYAFYDADLGSQLQDMDFESEAAPIESAYEPDEVKGQKWKGVYLYSLAHVWCLNTSFSWPTGCGSVFY